MIRFLTWLLGIGFILLGLAFCFWMPQLANQSGIVLTSGESVAGLRTIYGGLHLAIGSFALICARYRLYTIGVLSGTLAATGLAVVRTIGMFTDHALTTTQLVLLAPEVMGAVIGVVLIPQLRVDLRLLAQALSGPLD